MTGFCASDDHNNCPNSQKERYDCGCPCHAKRKPYRVIVSAEVICKEFDEARAIQSATQDFVYTFGANIRKKVVAQIIGIESNVKLSSD